MPPESLSTTAVMKPGPRTARKTRRWRLKRESRPDISGAARFREDEGPGLPPCRRASARRPPAVCKPPNAGRKPGGRAEALAPHGSALAVPQDGDHIVRRD